MRQWYFLLLRFERGRLIQARAMLILAVALNPAKCCQAVFKHERALPRQDGNPCFLGAEPKATFYNHGSGSLYVVRHAVPDLHTKTLLSPATCIIEARPPMFFVCGLRVECICHGLCVEGDALTARCLRVMRSASCSSNGSRKL